MTSAGIHTRWLTVGSLPGYFRRKSRGKIAHMAGNNITAEKMNDTHTVGSTTNKEK